jgi:hypothetical protein
LLTLHFSEQAPIFEVTFGERAGEFRERLPYNISTPIKLLFADFRERVHREPIFSQEGYQLLLEFRFIEEPSMPDRYRALMPVYRLPKATVMIRRYLALEEIDERHAENPAEV